MLNLLRKLSSRIRILKFVAKWGPHQDLGGVIRGLIFFILFYLYLWLYVDLRLIYHGGGRITNFPVFLRGWTFFRQFISHPGGPVEYAAAFLSQSFYYSWTGALVVTLLAWLICLCTDYFLRAISTLSFRWIRFIPPILLLIIYSHYTYYFAPIVALLTALFFACLYLRITPTGGTLFCLVVFLVLSAILYYIAGGGYLLFAALCAIYALLFKRRWQIGLLFLLLAVVIPYVEGVKIFGVSVINAFSQSLPFSWKIIGYETRRKMVEIVYILYLFLPLTALVLGLCRRFITSPASLTDRPHAKLKKKPSGKPANLVPRILSFYTGKPIFRWAIQSLVLFAVTVGAVFSTYDKRRKTEFEVDYYACHKMWPQLLGAARRYPRSPHVINAVNRALYHTGRLGYDMFSYPQHPDAFLLTAENHKLAYWDRFDTRIELGLISMAENDLTECLVIFGRRPIILKRLALVNMVKGNIGSARIYLGALSKTFFYTNWANKYLDRLESGPNLSTDEEIQRLRHLCLEKDHSAIFSQNENSLLALLEKNRQNRMAFEYLMAWYLLTKQLDKFVQNLERLNDFSYSDIPQLYEEAILVYVSHTKKPVHLNGRWGNPESRRRIENISQIYDRYGRDEQAAFDELAKNYGNSYFFYNIYGISGAKK